MKLFAIILMLLSTLVGQSQKHSIVNEQNNIEVEVAGLTENYLIESPFQLTVRVKNNSSMEINVPQEFFGAGSATQLSNFRYEVFDLNACEKYKDPFSEEDVLISARALNASISLRQGTTQEYIARFPKFFFKSKGRYKIRFVFLANLYNRNIPAIVSNWYYITLNK